ncbi:MAG: hypothetical protein AMR96_03165 [Candidatus Adiutrix intracellularis]|nr:MAG: hypothetical protein AMR96_03165 [Candidatus Adiutrix intracellularis]
MRGRKDNFEFKQESCRFRAAWLRRIEKAYQTLLWCKGVRLKAPVTFGLMKGQAAWGIWLEKDRRLLLSEELLLEYPWSAVLGVLGHETAHQLVSDLVIPEAKVGQLPHGPAFRRMGEFLGVDPFYMSGAVDLKDRCPCPVREAASFSDPGRRILEKVRKILALTGSPVEAEAQAAMDAAARLMARHNLERLEDPELQIGSVAYEYRQLNLNLRRIDQRLVWIVHILGRHYFVRAIFVPTYTPQTDTEGQDLELLGWPENVCLAEHVFHFLMERTESLWQNYRRTHRGGGLPARNSFFSGLLCGFDQKLSVAAGAKTAVDGFSALVLARDQGLNVYFRRRHPHVTNIRGAGGRRFCLESSLAGAVVGRGLTLNMPVEGGPIRMVSSPCLLASGMDL